MTAAISLRWRSVRSSGVVGLTVPANGRLKQFDQVAGGVPAKDPGSARSGYDVVAAAQALA